MLNCEDPCALAEIPISTCIKQAGLKALFWALVSDIDLEATKANINADYELSAWVMEGAAVFNRIYFEREQAFYSATYTEDTDTYETLIQLMFEGKNAARTVALRNALGCCNIVIHTFDNSCVERVFGLEFDGTDLFSGLKPMRIGRHLDQSGQKGSSKSSDEIDIIGKQDMAPLFGTVTIAAMPV